MREPKLLDELKENFTILDVNFEEVGEEGRTIFLFKANEVSHEQANNLWNNFNEEYDNGDYTCSFEEYLNDKGIAYFNL